MFQKQSQQSLQSERLFLLHYVQHYCDDDVYAVVFLPQLFRFHAWRQQLHFEQFHRLPVPSCAYYGVHDVLLLSVLYGLHPAAFRLLGLHSAVYVL